MPVPPAVCSLNPVPSSTPLLDPVTPPHLPVTKDRSWVAQGWRQTAARVWRSAKGGGRSAAENARVSQRWLCSLQASFVGGANFPPPSPNKTYIFPPNGCQMCALNFFSARTMSYKYVTETFFYWTTNTGNYSLSN